jgi:hypothetical protein
VIAACVSRGPIDARPSSMKTLLTASALALVMSLAPSVRAERADDSEPVRDTYPASRVRPIGSGPSDRSDDAGFATRRAPPRAAPAVEHPTPRLKLTYVRFSVGDTEGRAVPLEALHLDMYALSWRWLRAGLEAEAGRGHATFMNASTSLRYGLVGANGGLQLPGRVTPFIEGRLAGGVMGATLEETVMVTGVGVSGASAATWMYLRGVNAGVEVYTFGRAYVSAALGWVRSTYRGADYDAMNGLKFMDVTRDSFLLKLGLGI